ncbi:helix-turn-helix domain-containing protein [Litorimonas sp. WD9-15]|uniref:helix-turn-helix domain-containing protein n=1 Tax=Litorimonas sp. WD9-15 TaxID=3418716 RepID=UPI003D053263
MARRYSAAGISKNLTYTILEIQEIRGTSPQTVRRWMKEEGLPAMTSQRPFLIHGADLIDFLNGKSNRGKNPHAIGELSCFKCGKRGRPLGDMADLVREGSRRRLKALCGECERPVSLMIGAAKLAQYREVLDIADSAPL